MNGEQPGCPKCGAALQRRLADLECPACGWFKPLSGRQGLRGSSSALEEPATGTGSGGRLQAAVSPPEGRGSYRGLLHTYERPQPDALSRWKLAFLITAGLLFTAGNLALLWLVPAVFPGPRLIFATTLGSFLALGIAAVALYVDWAGAKLIAALLALAFIALDIVLAVPLWPQYVLVAKAKHVVDALLLLAFAWLLLYEWRRENSPD
ncbi:zinc ribbon domain-containing protein [bacterium]|nr:zinc ribbon domain-containing protein [bacterium]